MVGSDVVGTEVGVDVVGSDVVGAAVGAWVHPLQVYGQAAPSRNELHMPVKRVVWHVASGSVSASPSHGVPAVGSDVVGLLVGAELIGPRVGAPEGTEVLAENDVGLSEHTVFTRVASARAPLQNPPASGMPKMHSASPPCALSLSASSSSMAIPGISRRHKAAGSSATVSMTGDAAAPVLSIKYRSVHLSSRHWPAHHRGSSPEDASSLALHTARGRWRTR